VETGRRSSCFWRTGASSATWTDLIRIYPGLTKWYNVYILTGGNVFQSQVPDILNLRPHIYNRENAGDRRCNAGWEQYCTFSKRKERQLRREETGAGGQERMTAISSP
jgi:hypothetical protein